LVSGCPLFRNILADSIMKAFAAIRKSCLLPLALLLGHFQVIGQTQAPVPEFGPADWNGVWIAEGTLFSVRVRITDGVLAVEEIQSLGQIWSAQTGTVAGNEARLPVSYLGATAELQIQMLEVGRAVVSAASCLPEYMVVCALAAGRQATFLRTGTE